jgi:hypothetical protein
MIPCPRPDDNVQTTEVHPRFSNSASRFSPSAFPLFCNPQSAIRNPQFPSPFALPHSAFRIPPSASPALRPPPLALRVRYSMFNVQCSVFDVPTPHFPLPPSRFALRPLSFAFDIRCSMFSVRCFPRPSRLALRASHRSSAIRNPHSAFSRLIGNGPAQSVLQTEGANEPDFVKLAGRDRGLGAEFPHANGTDREFSAGCSAISRLRLPGRQRNPSPRRQGKAGKSGSADRPSSPVDSGQWRRSPVWKGPTRRT